MTMGGRFLEKYYNQKNIISFDYEQMEGSQDKKFIKLIYGDDTAKKANKYNIREFVKPIIENNIKNPDFEKYVTDNVISKLKPNQKAILAFNSDTVPFIAFDDDIMKVLNSKKYSPHLTGIMDLLDDEQKIYTSDVCDSITSYSNKYLIQILDKYLKRVKIEQYIMTKEFYCEKTFLQILCPKICYGLCSMQIKADSL